MSTIKQDGRFSGPIFADKSHNNSRLCPRSDTDVVNGRYDGATHAQLFEHAWSSFHAPLRKKPRFYEGFYESPARHERYLAAQMQLRRGMRVLEVGCGVGGSAREIAACSDTFVVGVNDNEHQVQRARQHVQRAELDGQVEFIKGDTMNIVELFGENSLDAVYVIEPKCQAPSWEGLYGEIKKVLKPGGVLGVYVWCMTDAWDPSTPSHKELVDQLKELEYLLKGANDMPEMRSLRDARQAFINVGFKIEHEEDLAERPDALPWYYPRNGDLVKAQTPWDLLTALNTSWIAKLVTWSLRLFEMIWLAPKGTWGVCETLKVAGDALFRGVETKLFTPMYLIIARKPSEE